jgi:hypothetical protein
MLRYDIDVDERGKHQSFAILDDGDPHNPIRELLEAVSGTP